MPPLSFTNQYLNFYDCPACHYKFYDVWDCAVDNSCEHCGQKNIMPLHSWQLPEDGIDDLAVWDGSFEPLVDE